MNKKQLIAIIAAPLFSTSANASVIATESFDYPTADYGDGLTGSNGGSGFSGAWKAFGGSNVRDGIFAGNVPVTSTVAPIAVGNHARVQLSTSGVGIGRNLSTVMGTDNTTAWLSFNMQNNNTSTVEEFAVFFTTNGENRSTLFGATAGTGGQSRSDGQFDIANGAANADYAARDTGNHFILVRFDFGFANNDTVTIFNDPTNLTNFSGSGSAQITGVNATFDGIGMTAAVATLQIDEIRIGDTLSDVSSIPEPSAMALLGLSSLALLLRRKK